jgi:hypothetical protein
MSKCCCSSGNCCGQPQQKKTIAIDFLYLDTTICGRRQNTEKALDEAVSSVAVVLSAAGYEVKVNIASNCGMLMPLPVQHGHIRIMPNMIRSGCSLANSIARW